MNVYGGGTVEKREDSDGVIYFRIRLPRRLSRVPSSYKGDRDNYREAMDTGKSLRTREEAERLLSVCVAQRSKDSTFANDGPVTFKDIYTLWLESRMREETHARGTREEASVRLRGERSFAKVHGPQAEFWDAYSYALISFEAVEGYVEYLCEEAETKNGSPLGGSHVRGCIAKLKATFEYVKVRPNPCIGQKLPKKDDLQITYLTTRQQKKFFSSEDLPIRDRVMAGCLMGGGFRIGEFLSLEEENIDIDGASPHILVHYGGQAHAPRKGYVKGAPPRRVDLTEPGLSFWRLWMDEFYQEHESERVFVGPSGGYMKAWPETLRAMGLAALNKRVHPHMLRHTYAMSVFNRFWGGERPRNAMLFVQRQLGHKKSDTTERHYGHLLDQSDIAAEMRGEAPEPVPVLTAQALLSSKSTKRSPGVRLRIVS